MKNSRLIVPLFLMGSVNIFIPNRAIKGASCRDCLMEVFDSLEKTRFGV